MNDFFKPEKKKSKLRTSFLYVLEIVKVFLIALAIVIPVRYFLIQPFYVKGASMEPNFFDHEYLIIDEITYRLRAPERGDVIVFHYPRNPSQYYIKRVIGLPGEELEIKDGRIQIVDSTTGDTQVLDETGYLSSDVSTQSFNYRTVNLADDEYFVMGDNRGSSYDSRHFGPVKRKLIVGRALIRVLPFNRVAWFPSE